MDFLAVPAAMCEPYSSSSAEKVSLSSAGYRFRSGETGSAIIYCPIPYKSMAGGISLYMLNYRLFYRDTDGAGTDSAIYTYFWDRDYFGTSWFGHFLNSNDNTEVGYTAVFRYTDHHLLDQHLNGLVAVMYRANTSQSPAFTGFDINDTSF